MKVEISGFVFRAADKAEDSGVDISDHDLNII